jgi:hypothetical protein
MIEAATYRQTRRAALVGMVETTHKLAQFCVEDGEPLEDVVVLLATLRRILDEKETPT